MPEKRPRTALLIGAYGGEHVGDAAILGGVLLRLAEREGIERAFVCSFRPERTRRLAAPLATGVSIEVVPFGTGNILRLLRKSKLLVWAGGPIANRPRMLSRNLAVALLARACGIATVLEGVGINNLRSRITEAMAILILKLASTIAVRSRASAWEVNRLAGRECEVCADPAFDYCASRGDVTLTAEDRRRVEEFASRPAEALLVCVNARQSSRESNRPEFSRWLAEVARGLTDFARTRPVRFVFFPMEGEADSGRDVDAADELQRHLGKDVDFRIWRETPRIDALL